MGFGLLLGTYLLTYIPAACLIYFTIMPYAFVTATFLKSMFYQVIVVILSALFWLAFQLAPRSIAYMLIVGVYCAASSATKATLLTDSHHEYNAFAIVGSNNAIHPTHPLHRAWGLGIGWGIAEATLFYGIQIWSQFSSVDNAALFPSPTTPCGTFSPSSSYMMPFPVVVPTALMWLAVFMVNGILTLADGIVTSNSSTTNCRSFIFFLLHTIIHWGLYVSTWAAKSALNWCWASFVIPPLFIFVTVFYLWVLKRAMYRPSSLSTKSITDATSAAAQRIRERIARRQRVEQGDELDTSTFDRVEGGARPLAGGYYQLNDGPNDETNTNDLPGARSGWALSDAPQQHQQQHQQHQETPHTNLADLGHPLFPDYGRNDPNDIYDS